MLKIKADPTFPFVAKIGIPGGDKVDVQFIGKHKGKNALKEFIEGDSAKDRSDLDTLLEIVHDWPGVEGEFNKERLTAFLDEYHDASKAIVEGYLLEILQAKQKN